MNYIPTNSNNNASSDYCGVCIFFPVPLYFFFMHISLLLQQNNMLPGYIYLPTYIIIIVYTNLYTRTAQPLPVITQLDYASGLSCGTSYNIILIHAHTPIHECIYQRSSHVIIITYTDRRYTQ